MNEWVWSTGGLTGTAEVMGEKTVALPLHKTNFTWTDMGFFLLFSSVYMYSVDITEHVNLLLD